jgi:hypothetical protein
MSMLDLFPLRENFTPNPCSCGYFKTQESTEGLSFSEEGLDSKL